VIDIDANDSDPAVRRYSLSQYRAQRMQQKRCAGCPAKAISTTYVGTIATPSSAQPGKRCRLE
jgi:hypothetical protein